MHMSNIGQNKTSDTDKAEDSQSEWISIAYTTQGDLSVKQVGSLIIAISADLCADKFEHIDHELSRAQVDRMSTDALIAIPRTTYSARSYLKHWRSFVDRARDEMKLRGEPEHYLAGL